MNGEIFHLGVCNKSVINFIFVIVFCFLFEQTTSLSMSNYPTCLHALNRLRKSLINVDKIKDQSMHNQHEMINGFLEICTKGSCYEFVTSQDPRSDDSHVIGFLDPDRMMDLIGPNRNSWKTYRR